MTHAEGGESTSRLRSARAIALLAGAPADEGVVGVAGSLQRLCRAVTGELEVLGAAVHLVTPTGPDGVVASSSARIKLVGELQFTTGEGPCHDAFMARRPVLISDLRGSQGGRWPGYADAAVAAGVHAVFAFPLQVGAVRLGVLDVYAATAGSMPDERVSMALTFARIGTVLLFSAGGSTTEDLNPDIDAALESRYEIHQAQGMVMVALGVSLAEALVRMRADAFSRGLPLIQLARNIISGVEFLEP